MLTKPNSLYSLESVDWFRKILKFTTALGAITLLILVVLHGLWGYINLPLMETTPDGKCHKLLVWEGDVQVDRPCSEATGKYRIRYVPFPGLRTGN